ncbi:sortase domain-bontaining protein [uncultured Vagococcus sp.]|uniref:sortase domain-containing protein n=1 Tax=uncultured Vagococcus sp. TaxID=189676 RepID=UPI0028D1B6D6|nr:sortase [uncultured Vagococcus sp.]
MKKKLVIGLLALSILIGVAGTLSYTRSTQLAAQERVTKEKKEATVVAVAKKDTEPPTIEGQKDWSVTQGDQVDVLTGVTAKDNTNKDISISISPFSTDKVGDQKVTLTAEDQEHNKTSKIITVHVKTAEPKETSVATAAPAESVEPEAIVLEEQPVAATVEEVTAPEPAPVAEVPEAQPVATSEPTLAPNTMYVGGIAISYQNAGQGSGQAVIDSNPNVIATWGGNSVQSGSDGANTHFIGHNPGIFGVLFSLGGGSQITVTDGAGTPTYYTVNQIFQVDDYATGVADGQSYVDQIIGSGGGERITLQTCVNDDINLIVMANAS